MALVAPANWYRKRSTFKSIATYQVPETLDFCQKRDYIKIAAAVGGTRWSLPYCTVILGGPSNSPIGQTGNLNGDAVGITTSVFCQIFAGSVHLWGPISYEVLLLVYNPGNDRNFQGLSLDLFFTIMVLSGQRFNGTTAENITELSHLGQERAGLCILHSVIGWGLFSHTGRVDSGGQIKWTGHQAASATKFFLCCY